MGGFRTFVTFVTGITVGAYLAQTYQVPNVEKTIRETVAQAKASLDERRKGPPTA
jgi:hypothetical protein